MIRWVGVGEEGGRDRQTGCKGFCAGGDGLDGGDSYAEPFIPFLFFLFFFPFPSNCVSSCVLVVVSENLL